MKIVLIAEDDAEIAQIEKDYLEINGIGSDIAADGNAALDMIKAKRYDLLLLDVMLPGKNGFELCKEIRESFDTPILMVTAKAESVDKIRGLGFGADDYITKPFDPAELVARVKSHLARYERLTAGSKPEEMPDQNAEPSIAVGDLRILTQEYKVYVKGKEVKLPIESLSYYYALPQTRTAFFPKKRCSSGFGGMITSATARPSPCISIVYAIKLRRTVVTRDILIRFGARGIGSINRR